MNGLLRTWAAVGPRSCNALAADELQSLQDLQRLVDAVAGRVSPLPPSRSPLHPDWPSERLRASMEQSQSDDFSRSLPSWEVDKDAGKDEKKTMTTTPDAERSGEPKEREQQPPRFSAYSFSRLEVEHEREVGGVTHRTKWAKTPRTSKEEPSSSRTRPGTSRQRRRICR